MLLAFWEITRVEVRAVKAEGIAQRMEAELIAARRDYATEQQLKRYSLDEFKAGDFTRLSIQVGVLHDEFQSFRTGCRR